MERLKVAILPAGRFGIAIGSVFAANGYSVTLGYRPEGDRSEERCRQFNDSRTDDRFPGTIFPNNIDASTDLKRLAATANLIVIGTGSQNVERFFNETIKPVRRPETEILSPVKGFVPRTNQRISEFLISQDKSLKKRVAVLSGPNYAHEIIRHLPTVTVIASKNQGLAKRLQINLSTPTFRPYISNDVIGVELAGGLKTAFALALAMVAGMKQGENAFGAMTAAITWEMLHLAVTLGADQNTIINFAGIGDLVTSSRPPGRNYEAGFRIGQGEDPQDVLRSLAAEKVTVEGFDTVRSAVVLAKRKKVEVPILEALEAVIYKGLTLEEAGIKLMNRDLTYAGPQPVIDPRVIRWINKVLHVWGRKHRVTQPNPRFFGLW